MTDFGTSVDKVGKRATCANYLPKMCTTAPCTGLGIKDFDVIATHATKAVRR